MGDTWQVYVGTHVQVPMMAMNMVLSQHKLPVRDFRSLLHQGASRAEGDQPYGIRWDTYVRMMRVYDSTIEPMIQPTTNMAQTSVQLENTLIFEVYPHNITSLLIPSGYFEFRHAQLAETEWRSSENVCIKAGQEWNTTLLFV